MTEHAKQKQITLPKDFLLGAASSAHQVEGNNFRNDWWMWEQLGKLPTSGTAADHYERYEEDFALAQQIGLNSMRISIEWSRIEPEPGQYNHEEIAHYRKVLQTMKAKDLTRMVTLHHFTLPVWAAKQGGFLNKQVIHRFADFARLIARELGTEIELWSVINEPEVYTYMSYLQGLWPPFSKNPWKALRVFLNLSTAHKLAYQAIKDELPGSQVGIAKNNIHYAPANSHSRLDKYVVNFSRWYGNHYFLNRIRSHLDFIGLNYYFTHTVKFSLPKVIEQVKVGGLASDMGWRTYPKGLYYLVKDLHKYYDLPIYITENGIANAHDDMRQDFIHQHLSWLSQAIDEGVKVRGYYYWSLTDTYEWHDGFNPKFGLIEVDFSTKQRKIRPSADIYQNIKLKENS